jgi:Tfp pilus assembly protein PilE
MRQRPHKQAGFTLLEVFVIVIAIIILLVIAYLRQG